MAGRYESHANPDQVQIPNTNSSHIVFESKWENWNSKYESHGNMKLINNAYS